MFLSIDYHWKENLKVLNCVMVNLTPLKIGKTENNWLFVNGFLPIFAQQYSALRNTMVWARSSLYPCIFPLSILLREKVMPKLFVE